MQEQAMKRNPSAKPKDCSLSCSSRLSTEAQGGRQSKKDISFLTQMMKAVTMPQAHQKKEAQRAEMLRELDRQRWSQVKAPSLMKPSKQNKYLTSHQFDEAFGKAEAMATTELILDKDPVGALGMVIDVGSGAKVSRIRESLESSRGGGAGEMPAFISPKTSEWVQEGQEVCVQRGVHGMDRV
jgi:hypothetical protein